VFNNLSVFIGAKEIYRSMFLPCLVQIAHMNEREVSFDCYAFGLAGNITRLL